MPQIGQVSPLASLRASLIESHEQDVRDLAMIEAIAARNPDLVLRAAQVIRNHAQLPRMKKSGMASTQNAVVDRTTNVGTTSAIVNFLKSHPSSTTAEITAAIMGAGIEGAEVPRQAIAATLAMMTKRGRLVKTVKGGLNHYSIKE